MKNYILRGSQIGRKIKFRITLLLIGFNYWIDQITDSLLIGYKKTISVKNTIEENWLYQNTVGFFTESRSEGDFDIYMIPYYGLVLLSWIFWVSIAYALIFALFDYFNSEQKDRKKRKSFIYLSIILINIIVYWYLLKIYNP